MSHRPLRHGRDELASVRRGLGGLFAFAFLCSLFVNTLMLTGPLYMLQVYDRVIGGRSQETLVALSLLAGFLFVIMGILDHVRSSVMAIAGARFQDRLDRRVFDAAVRRLSVAPNDPNAIAAQRDLEAVQRLIGSPGLIALFDIPWTPLFIGAMFIFHPLLGWMSVAGGLSLILIALLNQTVTRKASGEASVAAFHADRLSDHIKAEADIVRALGMTGASFDRWQIVRRRALTASMTAARRTMLFSSLSRTFRLFLQSAILGLGACLVLRGEINVGLMMASSIMIGRALAPIEIAVGQWGALQRGRDGWSRLIGLLQAVPADGPRTSLPRPTAKVEVENLSVAAPGGRALLLGNVSFSILPGQAVGVIGPSGAGKSSLARALAGVWSPAGGTIRLDGATLDQFAPDVLGSHIGYLPQRVTLLEGTIAENIARLQGRPDAARVVDAAKRAGAHDMILRLPDGYDTGVDPSGGPLSGGQLQRIGLARALYGNPVLLVLDEPNSNLDNDGSMALNLAIRTMKAEGCAIFVMAHRPAAVQECDHLLFLEDGLQRAFGPRDRILRDAVRNHTGLLKTATERGAA
jgi:ATP-binding cassette subfamily C protein